MTPSPRYRCDTGALPAAAVVAEGGAQRPYLRQKRTAAVDAPVAEKAAADADAAMTPAEAEPMKGAAVDLGRDRCRDGVSTAATCGSCRFPNVDLSKLVELRTLKGHSGLVRRAASAVLL